MLKFKILLYNNTNKIYHNIIILGKCYIFPINTYIILRYINCYVNIKIQLVKKYKGMEIKMAVVLKKDFPELDKTLKDMLEQLQDIYNNWNKVAVVSSKKSSYSGPPQFVFLLFFYAPPRLVTTTQNANFSICGSSCSLDRALEIHALMLFTVVSYRSAISLEL